MAKKLYNAENITAFAKSKNATVELPDECLVTMHDSEYFKERLRWWGH